MTILPIRSAPIVRRAALVLACVLPPAAAAVAAPPTRLGADEPVPTTRLADAEPIERRTIDAMLAGGSWARHALALMRLERFDCDESLTLIRAGLDHPQWPARAFAIRSLVARGGSPPNGWLDRQEAPQVVLAALRAGWPIDAARMGNGYGTLSRSESPSDRLRAVELAYAGTDAVLRAEARDLLTSVINRLDRTHAGTLAPRLRRLTDAPSMRFPQEWRNWLRRERVSIEVSMPGLIAVDGTLPAVARLPVDHFVALEQYMAQLATRRIDLAVLIDCTASMSGDLAQVQTGVDDLVDFLGAVSAGLRIAIVGYRDRNDTEFEVRPWDFSDDIAAVRSALWSLGADGGGDRAESVHAALLTAFTQLSWNASHAGVLTLIGDAPPHPGQGRPCAELAARAATLGVVTHTIQTRLRRDRAGARTLDVEHFPEIADAGNGRCVTLAAESSLVAEIAGLTVGDRFAIELGEFYRLYLDLCR